MTKIACFFAQGFEETEAIMTVDLLRRAGADVKMIGISEEIVIGSRAIPVCMDMVLEEWDQKADCLILPGGGQGSMNLAECKELKEIFLKNFKENKLICAICAAPAVVLDSWGILKDKKVTGFPDMKNSFKQGKYVDQKVVVDGNVITSQALGTLFEFNFAIIEYLFGAARVKEIKAQIIY